MGIHITSGEGGSRHIEPITTLMELAGGEQVVEPPDLAAGRHPEALASGEQAPRPIEEALVQLELGDRGGLVWIGITNGQHGRFSCRLGGAEEDQPVGAIGGEGKGDAQSLKPVSQPRRGRNWQGEGSGQGFRKGAGSGRRAELSQRPGKET